MAWMDIGRELIEPIVHTNTPTWFRESHGSIDCRLARPVALLALHLYLNLFVFFPLFISQTTT